MPDDEKTDAQKAREDYDLKLRDAGFTHPQRELLTELAEKAGVVQTAERAARDRSS